MFLSCLPLSIIAIPIIIGLGVTNAKVIPISAKAGCFDPELVDAAVGDILEFHFLPSNHSVVMGDIEAPCVPAKTGGFFSGFLPAATGENPEVFRVTINDTNPIVYYCSQNDGDHRHCAAGMVGGVNYDNKTLELYKCEASKVATAVSPTNIFGGILTNLNDVQPYTAPAPKPSSSSSSRTSSTSSTTSGYTSSSSTGVHPLPQTISTTSPSQAAPLGGTSPTATTSGTAARSGSATTISGATTIPTTGAADMLGYGGTWELGLMALGWALAIEVVI